MRVGRTSQADQREGVPGGCAPFGERRSTSIVIGRACVEMRVDEPRAWRNAVAVEAAPTTARQFRGVVMVCGLMCAVLERGDRRL